MKHSKAADNDAWLKRLYRGELYKLPSEPSAQALVDAVYHLLVDSFQIEDIHQVHAQLSEQQFFKAMKHIRKHLFDEQRFIALLKHCFVSLNFKPGEIAFEPLRLRAIRHNGHLNPRAKAVYYPHRDTWYGHGQSTVVGWLPLHDQQAHQTFEIFPECLDQAVANNSEVFNYDEWRQAGSEKKIGWQNQNTGLHAVYPQALEPVTTGKGLRFCANRAERVFFSAAHFHKTLQQVRHITRFSVDFRFVYLPHVQRGLGAVNADARARGSALQDYIRL